MKLIIDKVNTNLPAGVSVYGDTRDDDGSSNGTPSNKDTWDDFFQFFDSLMAASKIADAAANGPVIANGQLDSLTGNYQIIAALEAAVRMYGASEVLRGVAQLATQAETNAGTDDARIVTPLKFVTKAAAMIAVETARAVVAENALQALITAINAPWITIVLDGSNITSSGGSITVNGGGLSYKKMPDGNYFINFIMNVDIVTPSTITITLPGAIAWAMTKKTIGFYGSDIGYIITANASASTLILTTNARIGIGTNFGTGTNIDFRGEIFGI